MAVRDSPSSGQGIPSYSGHIRPERVGPEESCPVFSSLGQGWPDTIISTSTWIWRQGWAGFWSASMTGQEGNPIVIGVAVFSVGFVNHLPANFVYILGS